MNGYWKTRDQEVSRRGEELARAPLGALPSLSERPGPSVASVACPHTHDGVKCTGDIMNLGEDGLRCFACDCKFRGMGGISPKE